jgi:hypothetical protein
MDTERDARKFLWWQTGVSPDKQAEVGASMIKAAIVWVGVLAVLAVIASVVA